MEGRDVFMNVLTERLREARVLERLWSQGNVEEVIDAVIDIHETNPSVAIDFFRYVKLDNEAITLRLCARILPILETLLADHCRFDGEHKSIVLDSVNVLFVPLFDHFNPRIKSFFRLWATSITGLGASFVKQSAII